ncbi:MAG: transporter substrate-binding domain-containing protein [Acidobacteria bacterium]|nr:transporter substrate-binding domain-containing protein [Acidobacteriota bacterium]
MTTRLKVSALLLASLLLVCAPACRRKTAKTLDPIDQIDRRANVPMTPPAVERDLAQIRARGTLTVLAPYNSTTYFVYRGEPLGYEYELLRAFASEHDLALKMIVVTDPKSLLPLLNSGEGDLAAARLIPTPEDEQNVSFTSALYRTEPALIQQSRLTSARSSSWRTRCRATSASSRRTARSRTRRWRRRWRAARSSSRSCRATSRS